VFGPKENKAAKALPLGRSAGYALLPLPPEREMPYFLGEVGDLEEVAFWGTCSTSMPRFRLEETSIAVA